MREDAIRFGASNALVGIATHPTINAANGRGIVLLNAGIVHRVGPNRLYVKIARMMANRGYAVLRFDHGGIGDSDQTPAAEAHPVTAVEETRQAMDWLHRELKCVDFVLVGLCSSTLTAYRTALVDDRVVSLVLLSALLEDPASIDESIVQEVKRRKTARSHITEKVFRPGSWKRLLTGATDHRRAIDTVVTLARQVTRVNDPLRSLPPGPQSVLKALDTLTRRGTELTLVFATGTIFLEYFAATLADHLERLDHADRLHVALLEAADHNFTSAHSQQRVLDLVFRRLSTVG